MTALYYRSGAAIEDLEVGECVMHRALTPDGVRFWHLWFRVNRDSDRQPDTFCVPMNPNGEFLENGPGGRTWGLRLGPVATWIVSPSINVLDTREPHPGEHPAASLWHRTPILVNVSPVEAWISEAP